MDSDARKMAYNNIINSRNLQMTNAKLISECVSQSKDDKLKKEYALYKKLRGKLAFKTTKEKRDSLKAAVKFAVVHSNLFIFAEFNSVYLSFISFYKFCLH